MSLDKFIQPFSIEEDHNMKEIDYPTTTEFKQWHNQTAPFGLQQLNLKTTSEPKQFSGTFCDDGIEYHGEVLDPTSKHFRQGYIVRVQGKLLGSIKKHHKPTLLSWKFSQGIDHKMGTWFAGIYTLPDQLYSEIQNMATPNNQQWGELTLDSLQLCPGRLLEENSNMYLQGRSHRDNLRKELLNIHKNSDAISPEHRKTYSKSLL